MSVPVEPTRARALLFHLTQSVQYDSPRRTEQIELHVVTHLDGRDVSGVSSYKAETDGKGRLDEEDLRDLHVGCYLSNEHEPPSYGWGVAFRSPYHVNLRLAERLFKTLKTIERRMARLDQKFGRPSDFGQYVARVAEALDVTSVGFKLSGGRNALYAANEYQFLPIGEAVGKLNFEISRWHESFPSIRQPEREEVAS